MIASRLGVEFTAASEAAVEAFDATVESYSSFSRDIGTRLKATFDADPTMPMAHVLKGYFFQYMAVPWALAKTPEIVARLRGSMDKLSAREQMHVLGLEAWMKGDLSGAIRIYESVLLDHPRDFLALKLANFFHFYLGDSRNVRDSVARVLHAWHPSLPFHGFVTSLYAFGLEETGRYSLAEHIARAALEANPRDAWAVHTVAHCMEARDKFQDGIAFMEQTEAAWSASNNFRYHLWWHRLLLHLGKGDTVAVLELYDQKLWNPESDEYLDLANDISMLQRLEIVGVDVDARWQPLADKIEKLCSTRYFAFIDAHYVLALAAADRVQRARLMLEEMKAHATGERNTVAEVTNRVGLALGEGLLQYRVQNFERTVDCILPVRDQIRLIGGSHAQRDLFDLVLADAAIKAKRHSLARALLSERFQAHPRNVWNKMTLEEAARRLRKA